MTYPNIQLPSLDIKALQESLQAKGVKYAIASFVDIHGMCKGKVVPIAHFNRMMSDLKTATVLPWNSEVVWFASNEQSRMERF